MELTHVNANGEANMVDVSQKAMTKRQAVVQGRITMQKATLEAIRQNAIQKGDVLSVARVAGILAAKNTANFIPLCHTLPLSSVEIQFTMEEKSILIEATTNCVFQTGVEMEAFTAVSIAALTIYDMCKAMDRSMEIGDIYLLKKSGGKSGTYIRQER